MLTIRFWGHFFSFTIRLEDYESKLSERTLYLVARYICPIGEFWDNNEGANYRVGFRRASTSPLPTPLGAPRLVTKGHTTGGGITAQQRTFSAPSSLKCTPVTGSAAVVNRVTADRRGVSVNVPGGADDDESEVEKTPIEQYIEGSGGDKPVSASTLVAPTPLIRRHSSPQNPNVSGSVLPLPVRQPTHSHTAPQTSVKSSTSTRYLSRRLSLSNYVAPSPVSPTNDGEEKEVKEPLALATPPTTPPRETRLKDLPDSASISPTRLSPLTIIGGMPATALTPSARTLPPPSAASVPLPSSSSSSSSASSAFSSRSSSYADMYPLNIKTSHLVADTNADADDLSLPFSPTGRSGTGFKMSSLGAQLALSQLASPPVSNEGSEASSPSSSGRNSPTRRGEKEESGEERGNRRASPTRLEFAPLENTFKEDVKRLSMEHMNDDDLTPTATDSESPVRLPTPTLSKRDSTDPSYAAFVRQWCFAQSAPPTPGVVSSSPGGSPSATSGNATPNASSTSSTAPSVAAAAAASSLLSTNSYTGPNGFGLGVFGGMVGQGYMSTGPVPRRQPAWSADHVAASGGVGYGFPEFTSAHAANKRHHHGSALHQREGAAMVGGESCSSAAPVGTAAGYGMGIAV